MLLNTIMYSTGVEFVSAKKAPAVAVTGSEATTDGETGNEITNNGRCKLASRQIAFSMEFI